MSKQMNGVDPSTKQDRSQLQLYKYTTSSPDPCTYVPAMVVLSAIQQLISTTLFPDEDAVPIIDLTNPDSKSQLIHACEQIGFFKVINHGIPNHSIAALESEALKFFSLPLPDKEKAGPADPLGYGRNRIGRNGDVGCIEYLLLTASSQSDDVYRRIYSVFGGGAEEFRCAVDDYLRAVKRMACEILEMLAEGLKIEPRNALSKMVMDEQSDSLFRVNHYSPCGGSDLIGFGEHTDPQIIAVLRSNNASGLQILVRNGKWISVPPDENSFFINVGDSLQVMTNGRFRSVKHRVVANCSQPRLSMIYLGGPPLTQRIAPLVATQEHSLYKEFTWFDYKNSAYNSNLADNRLGLFHA